MIYMIEELSKKIYLLDPLSGSQNNFFGVPLSLFPSITTCLYMHCAGRITVFALTDCSHCQRTKAALSERGLPYSEINLSSHPDRRNDMLSLCDRLTVPQVFFNSTHIGGADDTLQYLQGEWDNSSNKTYASDIASQPDPTDPRLAIPTGAPVQENTLALDRPEEYCIVLPSNSRTNTSKASVVQVITVLKSILPLANIKHYMTLYKNVFTGEQFVEAVCRHYNNASPADAIKFGRELQTKHQVLHLVVSTKSNRAKTHEEIDNASSSYFRLQCHHTPHILNSYRVWTERVDPDGIALVQRLKAVLGKIKADGTAASADGGGGVNYRRAVEHPDFDAFQEAVCELQGVTALPPAMDDNTRTAFGINVYNLMVQYAFTKVGIGTTDLNRASFFTSVSMNLGGHVLTLNDLENGVLRSNRRAPYTLSVPFGTTDPRLPLAVAEADCRIHFALNCGARSCPPVKSFTAHALQEELRIVAAAFCEQDDNVKVDEANKTLYLSTILYWYRIDFAPSKGGLPAAILPFLRGEKKAKLERIAKHCRVKFLNYDWSTDASEFVPFDKSALRANETGLLKVTL
jgi:glutaredoxin